MANYKAPPVMREELQYEDWKKELQIWVAFTDIEKKRQGGALFFTLSGKPREAVLAEIDVDKLKTDDGVKTIVETLDKLYLQDKAESGFQAFDSFIKFRRPASMSIKDYVLDFNIRYSKLKCHDMALPEGVLAYTLLTCCNLNSQQEQICRTTCKDLTFKDMKQQIERIALSNQQNDGVIEPMQLVTQPQPQYQYSQQQEYYEYGEDEYSYEEDEANANNTQEDAYFSRPGRQSSSAPRHYRPPPYQPSTNTPRAGQLNPPDEFGKPSPCRFCRSIYHWVDKCPYAPAHYRTRGRGRGRFGRGGGQRTF